MRHITGPRLFGVVFIGVGVLLPVGFEGGVPRLNKACGDLACCFEIGAICGGMDDWKPQHYTSGDGSCPE